MEKSDFVTTRVLHDFASRIEKLGIDYMLTGSLAMNRYTTIRQTADIDVVLEVSRPDADQIIKEFESTYYVPVNAVQSSIDSEGMFNLIHLETTFKVDCIVKKTTPYAKSAFNRREITDYYGGDIWTISKEDLILSKLQWAKESHSEMQRRDIVNLMRSGFDKEYVEKWISKLNLYALFDLCVKDANQ